MNDNFKHKKSGFTVPKDYFKGIEERLMLPVLEERLPKEQGFTVPEGYFDSLNERLVAASVPARRKSIVRKIAGNNWMQYAAVAAVVAVIVSLLWKSNTQTTSTDEIDLASIESYLHEGYVTWDSEDIMSMATTETWEDVEWDAGYVSEEQIESYLIDHIEANSLITE